MSFEWYLHMDLVFLGGRKNKYLLKSEDYAVISVNHVCEYIFLVSIYYPTKHYLSSKFVHHGITEQKISYFIIDINGKVCSVPLKLQSTERELFVCNNTLLKECLHTLVRVSAFQTKNRQLHSSANLY